MGFLYSFKGSLIELGLDDDILWSLQDPISDLFRQVVPYSKHFEGVRSERVFANFATSARAMRRKRDDGSGAEVSIDR